MNTVSFSLFPIQPPGSSGCSAVAAAARGSSLCWARVWAVAVPGASGIRGTKEQRPQQAPDCGAWHTQGTARSCEQTRRGHSYTRGCTGQSDLIQGLIWGCSDSDSPLPSQKINRTPSDEECFFDLLSKFQSNRMDDQRCPLEECPAEAAEAAATRVPALGERICEH